MQIHYYTKKKKNPHIHFRLVRYLDDTHHPVFSFQVTAKQKRVDDLLVYYSEAAVEVSAIHDHYNAVRALELVVEDGC